MSRIKGLLRAGVNAHEDIQYNPKDEISIPYDNYLFLTSLPQLSHAAKKKRKERKKEEERKKEAMRTQQLLLMYVMFLCFFTRLTLFDFAFSSTLVYLRYLPKISGK